MALKISKHPQPSCSKCLHCHTLYEYWSCWLSEAVVTQCWWCHSATFLSQCGLHNVEYSIFLVLFLPLPRIPWQRTRIMTLQWTLKVFNLSQHWVWNKRIWGLTNHATAVWLTANGTKTLMDCCLHNFYLVSTTKTILNPACAKQIGNMQIFSCKVETNQQQKNSDTVNKTRQQK